MTQNSILLCEHITASPFIKLKDFAVETVAEYNTQLSLINDFRFAIRHSTQKIWKVFNLDSLNIQPIFFLFFICCFFFFWLYVQHFFIIEVPMFFFLYLSISFDLCKKNFVSFFEMPKIASIWLKIQYFQFDAIIWLWS